MVRHPLSEYRTELMGLGAIGILIAHSHAFLGLTGKGLLLMSYLGFVGVYLFCFLSGIGLVFAMKKGIKRFYLRRLSRVILPYLVISTFFWGIKYLPQGNVGRFFYIVSTLAYWVEHEGAWYVAMLIPLYCVYPVIWYANERFNYRINDGIMCLVLALLSVILDCFNPDVYSHFCKVINCYFVFLLGDVYTREANKNGYKNRLDFWCASLMILVFFACKLSGLKYYHFTVSRPC